MIESRNDLILRILDEIAFLAVRLTGMKAMGMSDEVLKEVERLEQAAGRLDAPGKDRVATSLADLRKQVAD